jgi:hypothetical protein
MSANRGRQVAVIVLVAVLLLPPLLTLLPGAPAAVRVGGIPVLWWYTGVVAPLLATILAVLVLRRATG